MNEHILISPSNNTIKEGLSSERKDDGQRVSHNPFGKELFPEIHPVFIHSNFMEKPENGKDKDSEEEKDNKYHSDLDDIFDDL